MALCAVLPSTLTTPARADGACQRAVEVRLSPVPNLQLAVWIEDRAGHVIDTIYVTRSTGLLGLGNRPGEARFRSDYRFPYGAREMVLPVWAFARQKTYPRVVMGGLGGIEDNASIGYHFAASSPESFYCSPTGGTHRSAGGVDTVSCASPFYGSKGHYAATGGLPSRYPPRGDLSSFNEHDSDDARHYAEVNDLAAVSGATPMGAGELTPPLRYMPPADTVDGDYLLRVEASLEADFNPSWSPCTSATPGCPHPTQLDEHAELQGYGRDVLGQPSLTWSVPFHIGSTTAVSTTATWQGYGAWDGTSGELHAPDATISVDRAGSGAQRLRTVHDGDGDWQVKVTAIGCDKNACTAPSPVGALALSAGDTTLGVTLAAPGGLLRPDRYDVRYAPSSTLDDASFMSAIPADTPPLPAAAGAAQHFELTGLKADTVYTVGVRALAPCGKPSPTVFATASTTAAKFATLSGCFVATAAYGSSLAPELDGLRRWRDRVLLTSPAGRAFVAVYYAFGPALANALRTDEHLRSWTRMLLAPLVAAVNAR